MELKLTEIGKNLLLRAVAGEISIDFTEIQLGNGSNAGEYAASLSNKMLTVNIAGYDISNDFVTLNGYFTNQDVTEGFRATELGVLAKDPNDSGLNLLYAYAYTQPDTADYIPVSTDKVLETKMDIMVYVGNETEVNVTVSGSQYVSEQEFEDHIKNKAIHSTAYIKSMFEVTIPETGWELEAPEAADFPYSIELPYEGVLDTHNAEVTVDKESIQVAYSCGLCPTMETLHNGLKFWSRTIPEVEILCHMTLFGEGGLSDGGAGSDSDEEVTE